ncbi:MAG TPA: hypothetical protein VIU16_14365, partial [Gaiellaceae bacterium]
MQVLVLAVQNAVPYEVLGVATSGSTLFRQVGGSIGVAIFGTIFANRLTGNLASRIPPGTRLPSAATPAVVDRLPPSVHDPYVAAFAASLRPVYVVACGIAFFAFALSWLLREVPLRRTVTAEGVSESFAMPRDASSLREMERIVSTLVQRENRWRVYQRIAEWSGVDLPPAEYWLVARVGEGAAVDLDDENLARPARKLRERGLLDDGSLTPAGAEVYERFVAARRGLLAELLEGWEHGDHDELEALLDRMARELAAEVPDAP